MNYYEEIFDLFVHCAQNTVYDAFQSYILTNQSSLVECYTALEFIKYPWYVTKTIVQLYLRLFYLFSPSWDFAKLWILTNICCLSVGLWFEFINKHSNIEKVNRCLKIFEKNASSTIVRVITVDMLEGSSNLHPSFHWRGNTFFYQFISM